MKNNKAKYKKFIGKFLICYYTEEDIIKEIVTKKDIPEICDAMWFHPYKKNPLALELNNNFKKKNKIETNMIVSYEIDNYFINQARHRKKLDEL